VFAEDFKKSVENSDSGLEELSLSNKLSCITSHTASIELPA